MKRHHPAPASEVPISRRIVQLLTNASVDSAFAKEDWEIAEMAILEWAGRNSPNSIPTSLYSGYQWKEVFLPNGTVLRTTFKGKNHHCLVEDDGLRYAGKLTSPSGFANLVGGTNRNAWKVVWILLPGTQDWMQASKLRPRVPAPPARRRR